MSSNQRDCMAALETVILEQSDEHLRQLLRTIRGGVNPNLFDELHPVGVPPAATRSGVDPSTYHGYRKGLASACADVVLVRNGQVPLIKRKRPPFEGTWWIMGGVIFNYRPIHHFLIWKALKESGLTDEDFPSFADSRGLQGEDIHSDGITFVDYLGVARTATDDVGPDKACDTLNLCGMAVMDPDDQRTLRFDEDHEDIRWVTEDDLVKEDDPGLCGHWYPDWAAWKALRVYNQVVDPP